MLTMSASNHKSSNLRRYSSNDSNEIRALLDKMLQSTDAATVHLKGELFQSAESGLLRDLMKSSGSTASQIIESVLPSLSDLSSEDDPVWRMFKSGATISTEIIESVVLSNFLKSADRTNVSDDFLKSATSAIINAKLPSFNSRDWLPLDVAQHIDSNIVSKLLNESQPSPKSKEFPVLLSKRTTATEIGAPTSRRRTRTNWQAIYETGLASVSATSLEDTKVAAPVQSLQLVPPTEECSTLQHQQKNNSIRVRRPRDKKEPLVKEYVVVQDVDVLCGRGGRVNHHPGNEVYLKEKDRIQPRYLAASKDEKTGISQELVDFIHQRGGRFLKLEPGTEDMWYEILMIAARKKASQTLREINTPEIRAQKRARYAK
jgi:hypothetical protein